MDMSLSKLWELVNERKALLTSVHWQNQKFEEVVKYSRASNASIKGGKGVLLQIAIIPSDQNAHTGLPASASVLGLLPSVPRDDQ